jgi:4-amino-4-deoxychorismate lyase
VPDNPAIWIDGSPLAALPLPDRGLDYGDGLFETLLLRRDVPLYPELHLARLKRGLQALAFPDCLEKVQVQLESVLGSMSNACDWSSLRLSVTRGGGRRGYAPPVTPQPRIIIQIAQIERDCSLMSEPASVSVAKVKLALQPMLAGVKHLNRLEQVLAAAEGQTQGVDEMLLLDQANTVNSVSAGNLFVVREGRLQTPDLCNSGVAGTRRQLVIERWAPALGLEVSATELTLEDLHNADEIFYSSSLFGTRPILSLDNLRWEEHKVCAALFEQFQLDLLQ